jgi:hypothetical protein
MLSRGGAFGRHTWMMAQRFWRRRSASASPTISRRRRASDADIIALAHYAASR